MTRAKTPPKHRADFTKHSAVIVCERPTCLWRCQAHTPQSAWRLYAAHCTNTHRDVVTANYALRRAFQNVRTSAPGSAS